MVSLELLKPFALVLGALCFSGAAGAQLTPPSCKVDAAHYDRIKLGMTISEVNGIVGCQGAYLQHWGVPQYAWEGVDGGTLVVTMSSKGVAGKIQNELFSKRTDKTTCGFDDAHVERLQRNLPLHSVVNIIGCQGLLVISMVDVSAGRIDSYQWSPKDPAREPLLLKFKDGALDRTPKER